MQALLPVGSGGRTGPLFPLFPVTGRGGGWMVRCWARPCCYPNCLCQAGTPTMWTKGPSGLLAQGPSSLTSACCSAWTAPPWMGMP